MQLNHEIQGYLTESKLVELFKNLGPITTQYKISRYKVDIVLEKEKIAIEFDGDKHYTDALTQERDFYKDEMLKSNGFSIIRIPYFIQLTNQTFEFFFGVRCDLNIVQNYKHGFVDNKCIIPASFNHIGIEKFNTLYNSLPDNIKKEIQDSLVIKQKKFKFVLFPNFPN